MLALFLIVVALYSLLLLHLIYPRLVGLYSVLPLAWLVCNTYNTSICIYYIYTVCVYIYKYIRCYVRPLRVTKIYIIIILCLQQTFCSFNCYVVRFGTFGYREVYNIHTYNIHTYIYYLYILYILYIYITYIYYKSDFNGMTVRVR